MSKKVGLKLFILIMAALIIVTAAFVATVSATVADESAEAAVSWKVRVAKTVGDNEYVDLPTGQAVTEKGEITFLVSNFSQGDKFYYYVFTDADGDVNSLRFEQWSDISKDKTINGVAYRYETYACNEKTTLYIYFRRQNSNDGDTVDELYSTFAHRTPVNLTFGKDDLDIVSVGATYRQNNKPVNYTGGWIGTDLTFTVTTKYMSNGVEYDSGNELLAYSVDGKPDEATDKRWVPMSGNVVSVKGEYRDVNIVFRVTNIEGKYPKYYKFPVKLNMDATAPEFSITATTADADGKSVDYSSGNWTSNRVSFTLTPTVKSISAVDYYVSTDGIRYEPIGQISTAGAYVVYNVTRTTRGLTFRAINAAGVIADYASAYNVNIDAVRPGITLDALTPNPDNERESVPVSAVLDAETSTYKANCANGQITLRAYNRDQNGKPVENTSGVRFYYAVKADGGEFSEFRAMTTSAIDAGDNVYYTVTDSYSAGVSTKRVYAFYVESGAGRRSNTAYYEVTILNSYFEIDVQEITYTPNASGWSAAPIPVYVNVPTDSTAIRNVDGLITGYTEPTTEYYFYYTPTNISGALFSVKGRYYAPIEGEEGRSTYVFDLSASAESVFVVYAKNAAGKESANRFTSLNVIKIDTVQPTVEHTAYVNPVADVKELTYIASGDWVNGSMVLEISVKQGVSGVYLKEMMSVSDANGNQIWIDGDTLPATGGVVNGYQKYQFRINVENAAEQVMSKVYKFRAYTNSGVYRDVEFLANIDTTAISLDGVELDINGEKQLISSDESQSGVFIFNPICENGRITVFSNEEQQGHFDCYIKESADGEYTFLEGNGFNISVPANAGGTITRYLYLVSKAKDYAGNSVTTEKALPFVLTIPYNTLNLSVSVELETDFQSAGTNWVDSDVTVKVSLRETTEGGSKQLGRQEMASYTFYYMLIPYGVNPNEAMRDGEWVRIDEGSWSTDGTQRTFAIPFEDKSFYGNVAASVANEAGYRSAGIKVEQVMRIDRTRPMVADMIEQISGETEKSSENGRQIITYYSKDAITIKAPYFGDSRSPITYYYAEIEKADDGSGWKTAPVTENPDVERGELNGWTKVDSQSIRMIYSDDNEKYSEYSYVFYAINGVGKSAGGISDGVYTQYVFILDGSTLGGVLSYDRNAGAIFDTSLNMVAFMWSNNVNISVYVTNSNTKVRYYYSIDGKKDEDPSKEWIPYTVAGGNPDGEWYEAGITKGETLIFDDRRFEETGGIVSEFSFKAQNKAGAVRYFGTKIFIAIDTTTPQFDVSTTVEGLEYDRDGTDNLTFNEKFWSSKPVTITIIPTSENVGGCIWEYDIIYSGLQEATTRRAVPGMTFTTDRLDGFNRNNDAIITLYAKNRANGKETSKAIRVKVDQIEPVFTILGQASDDVGGGGRTVVSNEWTNHANVNLSIRHSAEHPNVSGTRYTYTYSEPENPEPQPKGEWPASGLLQNKICMVTVTAVSGANVAHVETFQVNIDRDKPKIEFDTPYVVEGEKHYIDIRVRVKEENLEICEFITVKGDTRGFAFNPSGHIISTSSVDNSEKVDPKDPTVKYRGYVKIYAKDFAGNEATFELYMLPFALDVNNVTLTDQDLNMIEKYKRDLSAASKYMDPSRVSYFENLIARLEDRVGTIRREIAVFQDYLARLSQKTSFELRSDYTEMYSYMKQFRDYADYNQKWVQDAIIGEGGSATEQYFRNFEREFERLQGKMNEVASVEDQVKKLPAINMVEAEDYDDVVSVYNNYQNLTLDQRACFNANLYNKVTTLKKRCEILLLSDSNTGVSIDANFAPQARLKVESFAETSDYYNNAQTAIMSQKKDGVARAVISIYRVSLDGAASQTETGTVKVTLPIPEDYRQYIYFAVYTMSADGTIGDISDMQIDGTGRSVTFTNSELTTFVLAVRANIEVNTNDGESYGTILGLPLDVEMIQTLAIIGATLFVIILIVVIIVGIRHKRFLNSYNRAYKSGIYRRGVQKIPKGNTVPKMNPLKPDERVHDQKKPY